MDMKAKKYWDDIHSRYSSSYDGWLDKYQDSFNENTRVVELGCGKAYNSIHLKELGVKDIMVTDISSDVLEMIEREHPDIKTACFDLIDGIPFKYESTDVVIADLSLHYFNEKQLKRIMEQIKNILVPGGKLFIRVNSVNDVLHMPNVPMEKERNLYFEGSIYKKFFDREDIDKMCSGYKVLYCEEKKMTKYVKPKMLWEIALEK